VARLQSGTIRMASDDQAGPERTAHAKIPEICKKMSLE
jgi:hypothetical protein